MRYIYCDLGAYDGDSIHKFMQRRKLPIKPKEFEIYAFEPNPQLFMKLVESTEKYPNIQLDTGAAWTDDELRDFAIDTTETPMGSTLMSEKHQIWDHFDKQKVQCFDFSEWVKQFRDDYLIVKMDIEGGEFPILEKMIKDGTDTMMDQLWVETHPGKLEGYTTDYAQKLLKRLSCYVEDWS